MYLEVVKDKRRGTGFDCGQKLENALISAAYCDAQSDFPIWTEHLRWARLGCRNHDPSRVRQFFDVALQVSPSNRIARPVEEYLSRTTRLAQLGQTLVQSRQFTCRRRELRREHALLREDLLFVAIHIEERHEDEKVHSPAQ